MNKHLSRLWLAGFVAVAVSRAAFAGDFFDSALTIQGQTLDLGAAGRTEDFTAFTTNGPISASGTATIGSASDAGNIGVNGTSLHLNGSTTVFGNVVVRTNTSDDISGHRYTGTLSQSASSNSLLSQGAANVSIFSSRAASLTATGNYTASSSISGGDIDLGNHSSLRISATDNNPVVLKLTDFDLTGGTFTLAGTAMTKYIIDVSGDFSLSGNSSVVLSGGLVAGNVVFNVTGGGSVQLSGNSTLEAILLTSRRDATLSGNATIDGELIAQSITLSGGSKVEKPKRPSP